MADRWTTQEMLALAAYAVGKIDALGPRGATLLSVDEIEAMAGALVALGMVAIEPGATAPDQLIITNTKDDHHV